MRTVWETHKKQNFTGYHTHQSQVYVVLQGPKCKKNEENGYKCLYTVILKTYVFAYLFILYYISRYVIVKYLHITSILAMTVKNTRYEYVPIFIKKVLTCKEIDVGEEVKSSKLECTFNYYTTYCTWITPVYEMLWSFGKSCHLMFLVYPFLLLCCNALMLTLLQQCVAPNQIICPF